MALWFAAIGCAGSYSIREGYHRRYVPEDRCPAEPEDYDGFRDSDGCADPDNDDDGIADVDDACPNEPGELTSPSSRGCPA
ncbi:MAG TPA: hypothetical protein VIV11_30605 [Kofleriaceae bacterium]